MSRAVERALLLLQVVASSDQPLGLLEAAERAQLDKSTTARLLQSLTTFGFVTRDPASKKYHLGIGLLSLGASVTRRSELLRVARPQLERLRDLSEETTTLHVRVEDNRVCVEGFESWHAVCRVAALGEARPLWLGPTGKVILASLPPDEVATLLERAKHDGVDVARIEMQLAAARSNGHLATVGDRTPGVAAMSVPLFDGHGVMGSITVAGPAERWTVERMQAFTPTLQAVAIQLSAALGSAQSSRWLGGEFAQETT